MQYVRKGGECKCLIYDKPIKSECHSSKMHYSHHCCLVIEVKPTWLVVLIVADYRCGSLELKPWLEQVRLFMAENVHHLCFKWRKSPVTGKEFVSSSCGTKKHSGNELAFIIITLYNSAGFKLLFPFENFLSCQTSGLKFYLSVPKIWLSQTVGLPLMVSPERDLCYTKNVRIYCKHTDANNSFRFCYSCLLKNCFMILWSAWHWRGWRLTVVNLNCIRLHFSYSWPLEESQTYIWTCGMYREMRCTLWFTIQCLHVIHCTSLSGTSGLLQER